MISGLDVIQAEGFHRLRGQRIGLVAHPASVDSRLRHVSELLQNAPAVKLETMFGPEHGWFGHAQDLESVRQNESFSNRLPRVISLYGESAASLRPTAEQLRGLDVLLIDLQDVGARYYTFQATMLYCLEAANAAGLRVVILDRPNPIGGQMVEGPGLRSGYESFVGAHDVAIRHGLTIGELARLYQAERKLSNTEIEVVRCHENLPGVVFRAAWFQPTFQKHAGRICAGVQLHVFDPRTFSSVRTGLAVLAAMRDFSPVHFQWRTEPYEFVLDPIAIDLLFGSDHERRALEAGQPWREIAAAWAPQEVAFHERRKDFLLYD